jgi:hypothetical protein
MDFKDYQSQIKELIALRNAPDFNDLLNKTFFGESTSDKFLVKMELHRLAKPCQRIIDLRDKVTEECQLFQQGQLKHYLTAETIKVLEDNIALYGLYTFGVFEAVHLYVAEKKQQKNKQLSAPKNTKPLDQCEFLKLSQKRQRTAPRMFFVSKIALYLADGKMISAHTSNISSTGIKVKLKEQLAIVNQTDLEVMFTGLQANHKSEILNNKITYQVVKQKLKEDTHYLYLKAVDENPLFTSFINVFIRTYQYKYKIDLHYYYQFVQTCALKNAYIAEMNTLPVYLDSRTSSPFLFALKNQANKNILNEWHCDGVNQLPALFNELRLTTLLAHSSEKPATTLYCFTHYSNGKNYFISASEEELTETGLKNLFIDYGSSKKSWRIYHLTLKPYQHQSDNAFQSACWSARQCSKNRLAGQPS